MRYHHRRHQSWVLDEFTVTEPRTFLPNVAGFYFDRLSAKPRRQLWGPYIDKSRSSLKIAPERPPVNAGRLTPGRCFVREASKAGFAGEGVIASRVRMGVFRRLNSVAEIKCRGAARRGYRPYSLVTVTVIAWR